MRVFGGHDVSVAMTTSRYQVFTDEQWARIEPLLPSDLPRQVFGPWQTVWKRHRRYAEDGTCGTV